MCELAHRTNIFLSNITDSFTLLWYTAYIACISMWYIKYRLQIPEFYFVIYVNLIIMFKCCLCFFWMTCTNLQWLFVSTQLKYSILSRFQVPSFRRLCFFSFSDNIHIFSWRISFTLLWLFNFYMLTFKIENVLDEKKKAYISATPSNLSNLEH